MTTKENNYSVIEMGAFAKLKENGKYFAGNKLGLTSCEVSVNCIPAGQSVPFLHSHKKNEELYIITAGKGIFFVDGVEFPVQEGSLVRVAPQGERGCAATEEDLYYICIQAEAGSLRQATMQDGVISETKASWMK